MKIAFIGTGVMGKSMVKHLCEANHHVQVYNRTYSKAKVCEQFGAIAYESLATCVSDVEVIITIVGYPQDVKEVFEVIFKHAKKDTTIIDMTTSSPTLANELYHEGKKHQLKVLDAPVSGGDNGAKNGTLSIMVGGDKEVYQLMQPILALMGTNMVYMGEAGSGQHTKMANQIAIAGTVAAVTEALHYAKAANLNPEELLAAIGAGAAGSWQMSNTAVKMLEGNFNPGFYIKHFIKDMNLAQQEAKDFNLELPVLNIVEDIYQQLSNEGLADEGTQAIYKYYQNKPYR